MTRKLGGLILIVALVLVVGATKARTQPQPMDVSYFYDQLAPYGEWVDVSPWGYCFCPYNQSIGWRPYTDGDWIDSDYGWTFESDEPWAWACYHYGRWTFDPECGWIWVPGTVWGPAWVAWRFGGGNICGWAPLPPEVGFGFGVGLEFGGYDIDRLPWNFWCFTDAQWLGVRGLRGHIFDRDRNIPYLRETRNITNYSVEGNRVINRGIDPATIQQITHRPITRYQIAEMSGTGNHISRISGNTLQVFRPNILEGKGNVAPKNIIPPHLQVNQQDLLRRQALEKEKLNQTYQNTYNSMLLRHKTEIQNPPKGMTQEDLMKLHQNEIQSLQNQHQNEMHVLDNRHHHEQSANTEYHANQGTTKGGGGKTKH